jgi:hypothetical protein
MDHQGAQNLVVSCGIEPAPCIEKADPIHSDVLPLRCWPHDEEHQIVNQREPYQLFEYAVDCVACEDGEARGGFPMRIMRCDAPPGPGELGQGCNTIECGSTQRRDQGDGLAPKAFALNLVASLAALQAVRERCTLHGIHPVWTVKGCEPLHALSARIQPCQPA